MNFNIWTHHISPQTINPRFNTGLGNANRYLHQTMVLVMENRVPTAHLRFSSEAVKLSHAHSKMFSDEPLLSPADVDFSLSEAGQAKVEQWMEVVVAQILTDHCPPFRSCKKFIKIPPICFAERMASKSNTHILSVSNDDPSTTFGQTNVCLNMMKYVPAISESGEVRKNTEVYGDQGYVSLTRKCVASRAGEESSKERISALRAMPQDWHALKVESSWLLQYNLMDCRRTWSCTDSNMTLRARGGSWAASATRRCSSYCLSNCWPS